MDTHDDNNVNGAGNASAAQSTEFPAESTNATIGNNITTDDEGDQLVVTMASSAGVPPSQSMEEVADTLMEDIAFVDMPPLEDTESDSDDDRDTIEVEMQAVDATAESQLNPPEPPITSDIFGVPLSAFLASMPVLSRPNRRARVEDDDDEDRDRRHPSQRLNSTSTAPASSATANAPSTTFPHVHAPPVHATAVPNSPNPAQATHQHTFQGGLTEAVLLEALQQVFPPIFGAVAPGVIPSNAQNTPANDDETNVNPEAAQPRNDEITPLNDGDTNNRPPTFAAFDGFALSISMGENGQPRISRRPLNAQERAAAGAFPMPTMAPGPGEPNAQNLPNPTLGGGGAGNFRFQPFDLANLAPMFVGLGGGGFEEQEDPERAKKLVEGLEDVPDGLVKRLERVGGSGGGMGEDENRGGDGGCAICWDRLLPDDVQVAHKDPAQEEMKSESESEEPTESVAIDQEEASASEAPAVAEQLESQRPRIVSLPCAHVFHADCLIPWFSRPRHTTCPTCRFNIDPENLTYVSPMRRRREQHQPQREAATREQQPGESAQAADGVAPNLEPVVEGTAAEPASVPAGGAVPNVGANPANPRVSQPPLNGSNPGLYFGNGVTGFMGMGMMFSGPFPGAAPVPGPAMPPQPTAAATTGDAPPTAAPTTTQAAPNPPANAPAGNPQFQTMIGAWTIPMNIGGAHPQGGGGAGLPAGLTGNPWRTVLNRPVHMHRPQQPLEPRNAANALPPPNSRAGAPTVDVSANAATNEGIAPPHNPVAAPWQIPLPSSPPPTPPASNATPALQQPATRQPRLSDLRVTIDVVFDGGPFPVDPLTGDMPTTDDDMPPLVPMGGLDGRIASPEEVAEQQQQFEALFTLMDRNRRSWEDQAPTPAAEPLGVPPPPAGDGPMYGFNSVPQPELPFPIPRAPQASSPQLPLHAPAQQPIQLGQPARPGPVPVRVPRHPNANQLPGVFGGHAGAIPLGLNAFMATSRNGLVNTARPAGPPTADGQPPIGPTPQAPFHAPPGQPNPFGWQMPMPFSLNSSNFMRPSGPAPPKRPWAPPAAPGPTLRQRIERREREAGLRCHDVSCGLGPSDEEPLSDEVADTIKKVHQLTIRSKDVGEDGSRTLLCEHKFHNSCLVSAARVALRDAEAVVNEDGSVDVSCPVCRHEGCMMNGEWDDGVKALE